MSSAKLTTTKALSLLQDTLSKTAETTIESAKSFDIYKALCLISKDIMTEKREKFHSKVSKSSSKRVHYLCMEFLLGRNLKSTLFNLKLDGVFKEVLAEYKINIDDILVIYDDMDTDIGLLRLRNSGSAGGHNGLKSIISNLGSDKFKRIRVGIGKDPQIDIINYVLGKPRKEDMDKIDEATTKAMKAAIDFVNTPFDKVMSMYNVKG